MALVINKNYLEDDFRNIWTNAQSENGIGKISDAILITEPFRCFALPNFVDFSQYGPAKNGDTDSGSTSSSCVPKRERNFLHLLREELECLKFHEKKNDLYNFRQSIDLHNVKTPAIEAFKALFDGPVKEWLQKLTKIELNDRVAMTASAYSYGDHLLCHDDELEHRRIAYTFYLTPSWTEADGGRLDLFSSDDKFRPTDIAHSIVPLENMLAFFEVVARSFHQVSEVTSKDKTRWSINGWFHGETIERPKIPADALPRRIEPCFFEYDDLFSWINPDYFDPETQASIRQQVEEKSEIQLHHFLQTNRYDAIMAEFKDSDLAWKKKGPWNRRQYQSLEDGSQLDSKRFPNLTQCLTLMKSEAMYILLSQFTNMVVHPLYQEEDGGESSEAGEGDGDGDEYRPPVKKRAKEENGETSGAGSSSAGAKGDGQEKEPSPCEVELRKFEPGSYTVLSDDDFKARADSGEQLALDAQLFFTSCDWDTKHGGYTCYIEKDSNEELLTVTPCGNSLALVCSEAGTQKFVKYINRSAIDDFGKDEVPYFVDISGIYYEARPA